jgi:hypothetical protein
MSEKVEEKVAKEKTSITKETPTKVDKILPAIDKTEEARLQAEAALKGLAPKNVKTNNLGDRKVGSVPAEKALGWLKNGNKRFVTGKLRSDGQSAKDRLRTAHEQAPHAAIITCSDSRMIPELIFDQKLGEIYSVRVVDLSVALNVQARLDFDYHIPLMSIPYALQLNEESEIPFAQGYLKADKNTPTLLELSFVLYTRLTLLFFFIWHFNFKKRYDEIKL